MIQVSIPADSGCGRKEARPIGRSAMRRGTGPAVWPRGTGPSARQMMCLRPRKVPRRLVQGDVLRRGIATVDKPERRMSPEGERRPTGRKLRNARPETASPSPGHMRTAPAPTAARPGKRPQSPPRFSSPAAFFSGPPQLRASRRPGPPVPATFRTRRQSASHAATIPRCQGPFSSWAGGSRVCRLPGAWRPRREPELSAFA